MSRLPNDRGQGRKQIPDEQKRVTLSASVAPETLRLLHEYKGNKRMGAYLDELVQKEKKSRES